MPHHYELNPDELKIVQAFRKASAPLQDAILRMVERPERFARMIWENDKQVDTPNNHG